MYEEGRRKLCINEELLDAAVSYLTLTCHLVGGPLMGTQRNIRRGYGNVTEKKKTSQEPLLETSVGDVAHASRFASLKVAKPS